jgi:1D-myo-inositol-tetrakisphosphate 5-kinase/inositol-polyphosphate multikinase
MSQIFDRKAGKSVLTGKVYGKSLTPAQLPEGIARCFPCLSVDDNGLDSGTLRALLDEIIDEVREIRDMVSTIEMRMVGGSILIIYEADASRARLALEQLEKLRDQEEEASDSEAEGSEEDNSSDEGEDVIGPPVAVRLIDFAHTRPAPGQGPDEGVLKGLSTLIGLLEERAAFIAQMP